jgi:predicted nucleic acid-binding protein
LYLLDTNVLSEVVRKRPNPGVMARLRDSSPESLFTSCICVMELRSGAARLPDHGTLWRRLERDVLGAVEVLDVGFKEAKLAGEILARLSASGSPIDVEDVLIGSTALSRGLAVVTRNVRHFRRISGLTVEDWFAA